MVFRRICVNRTKHSHSKLQLSCRIFNSQEMFISQYNICSPASLRLRLPIHILSIVPLTSFSGLNIYYQTRPQAIRLIVCCPITSLSGLSLCLLSSTTPTFTACSTTVCDALPCGRLYSYIRFLHRIHRHAASIPHARYTQSKVLHLRRITIHLHNHTANTSTRGV